MATTARRRRTGDHHVPDLCLAVLVGATSSGKSTFARRHFRPTEIVSSDACRGLVADDENALDVNREAFGVLHAIVTARLALGRLTVVDATNVQRDASRPLLELARQHDVATVAATEPERKGPPGGGAACAAGVPWGPVIEHLLAVRP